MYYAGVDYHKRYSVVSVEDEKGKRVMEAVVRGNNPFVFRQVFSEVKGPVSVVFEAGWNWSWLYELLEQMPNVEKVVLAHAYKLRLIAETQIKTDKIDARKLALLLRLSVIPECHVPDRETRDRKEVVRQRAYWVRERTRLRNRVHRLVAKQHGLQMPQVTDIFGKRGLAALRKAVLPEPDMTLLRQCLAVLDELEKVIKATEEMIRKDIGDKRVIEILMSVPGIALIIASIIAVETDGIRRFIRPARYVGYCGLSPTTHSSGGHVYNGRMMWMCNKWLRWAYIEAAWIAVGCSAYFGGLYRRERERGKDANVAITIVARRMCRMVYQLLMEDRLYQEVGYHRPAALARV